MNNRTYGDQFKEAAKIENIHEAKKWLEKEIRYYMDEYHIGYDHAKIIIIDNLGYAAGFYPPEISKKFYIYFGAKHPYFNKPVYQVMEENNAKSKRI